MECGHNRCGACCGGICGGGALELTAPELDLLRRLAEIPFLPVARTRDSALPVFLEGDRGGPEETGAALTALARKGLIQIDWDIPLIGFDYAAYVAYSVRGSMALTARGQAVLDLLDIQGIEGERTC